MKGEYLKIETVKTLAELLNENKELQERIDKAVAYINNLRNYVNVEYYLNGKLEYLQISPYYIEELLKTLKGEQNE